MNYQHAFHAGNFADVHKHAVLARILTHLQAKPAAFRVIDTHAGAGRYDLLAAEPTRSGEWRDGIARVWEAAAQQKLGPVVSELLAPYLGALAACNTDHSLQTYPGSPLVVQHLLRPQDRLIACELEPRSAAALAATLRGDRRAKALTLDGWTAIGAYVPPKERRGLVLVDPPFEEPSDFTRLSGALAAARRSAAALAATLRGDRRAKALTLDGWTAIGAYVPPKERRGLVLVDPPFEEPSDFTRLSGALAAAHRKWPTGIYMLWYPIKTHEAPDALIRRLQRLAIAKILRCEITLGPPRADAGLVGSGLIVVNPPFTLEADLRVLLPALGGIFAVPGHHQIGWLTINP